MKGKNCKVKHVQEITSTHLKCNDARMYKENISMKYNVFICNGSNIYRRIISTYERIKRYDYTVK